MFSVHLSRSLWSCAVSVEFVEDLSKAYSSWVIPFLSLKSAPAQNALSVFDAIINALVEPVPPSA